MSALRMELGAHADAVRDTITTLRAEGFARRLAAHEDALWGEDGTRRSVAANRLGWLDAPASMRSRIDEFTAFADEIRDEGFTRVLLLGMGGSSLAPEVLSRIFAGTAQGLPLHMLDATSPAAVRAAAEACDPRTTLVLVASKSGGTVEVTSFEKAFYERAHATLGASAGRAFVAVTDPGTSLEMLAGTRHYRRVFSNPADIGGRYSALSCFGLVPAALLGIDVAELCRHAIVEHATLLEEGGAALELGAALGALALAGRDKLTLVMGHGFESLGVWIEQLVAESTGKQGRGILPIEGEALRSPEGYGDDRVFVSLSLGEPDAATTRTLDALAALGHPVLRWTRDAREAVGAEFMRWEIATAVAGAVLGVNPFDEPNVSEAKAATKRVLQQVAATGQVPTHAPQASDGPLALHTTEAARLDGANATSWAIAFLGLFRPGDYGAVLAYVHRTPAVHAALERVRDAITAATRAATTLGYGPRYLHSTGQLHKGGPGTGVFLEITVEDGDQPIPGESFSFRTLRDAQAAGDLEVLADHGLRAIRIHVSGEADKGLARLADAFEAARG